MNHSTLGTATVNAICNLALLTGQYRTRRRRAVFDHRPVQRDGHARSRLHFEHAGLPQVRRCRADRAELAGLWNIDEARLPDTRGLAYPDIIEAAVGEEDSRAVDHRHQSRWFPFPNQDVLRHALSNLDFLVVQDGYHPDADYELARPGASRRDLGRKRRNLHELRTAREQSEQSRRAAGRSAVRFRHLPRGGREARLPRRVVPGLEQTRRRVQRMAARLARAPVRLLRDQLRVLRAHGAMQWPFP